MIESDTLNVSRLHDKRLYSINIYRKEKSDIDKDVYQTHLFSCDNLLIIIALDCICEFSVLDNIQPLTSVGK